MAIDIQEMRCGMTRCNEVIYEFGASVFRLLADRPGPHSPDALEHPGLGQGKLETLVDPMLLAPVQSSGWVANESLLSVSMETPETKPETPKKVPRK